MSTYCDELDETDRNWGETFRKIGPPLPPEVMQKSQTANSITIKLKSRDILDTNPAKGYTLYYQSEDESSEEKSVTLSFGTEEFTLRQLKCGKNYNLNVTAYNS